jgi:hypothetical protein
MLALLAAATLPLTYAFPPAPKTLYDVRVVFEGYIPILGGQEGKVEVTMRVAAKGESPDADANPRASSEIETFKLIFNGGELPLGLESVRAFFPKTTISLSPQGKVLKTDAPDTKLPVKLPGLDVKRFPDITYLPIQFPEEGVEVGKAFSYRKTFGDSEVLYRVTPKAIDDKTVTLEITLEQSYEVWEDEGKNVVEKEADAIARVATQLTGKGNATFDRVRKIVSALKIVATADSVVRDVKTGEKSKRKLDTTLEVRVLKGA